MKQRRLICTVLCTVFLCVWIPSPGSARVYAEQELYAGSAVLMDADTGRILYGKNEDEIRPMASTTKIMTCILALENGSESDVVTISKRAASQPKVHLGAASGRTFYLKDLLYSLMLESHNDSAVAIAEHIGGSVEQFCEMMNRKAKELGCENTCFLTPNGLDESREDADGARKSHSTTARDLARIMAYCAWQSPQKEAFLAITRTQNHTFMDCEKKQDYHCYNHNAYLNMDAEALSGKTGFTGEAGYCYVAAVESEGRHFALALLGCGWPPHKTYKWSDAGKLFAYAKANFELAELKQEVELPVIPVSGGIARSGDVSEPVCVSLRTEAPAKVRSVLLGKEEKVETQLELEKKLTAPVPECMLVGRITYWINGCLVGDEPVVTAQSVPELTLKWCAKKALVSFLLSGSLSPVQ